MYRPTLISGLAARAATWSGGTWAARLTSPRTQGLDRGLGPGSAGTRGSAGRATGARPRCSTADPPATSSIACSDEDRQRNGPSLTRTRSCPAVATRPSIPAWAGPTGPVEPGAQPEQRPLQPDLDAGLVGRLDPVEQVGPARLVLRRVRDRSDRSGQRATSAAVTWREPSDQGIPDWRRIISRRPRSDGLERRGELAGHLALPAPRRCRTPGSAGRAAGSRGRRPACGRQGPSGTGTSLTATSSVGMAANACA